MSPAPTLSSEGHAARSACVAMPEIKEDEEVEDGGGDIPPPMGLSIPPPVGLSMGGNASEVCGEGDEGGPPPFNNQETADDSDASPGGLLSTPVKNKTGHLKRSDSEMRLRAFYEMDSAGGGDAKDSGSREGSPSPGVAETPDDGETAKQLFAEEEDEVTDEDGMTCWELAQRASRKNILEDEKREREAAVQAAAAATSPVRLQRSVSLDSGEGTLGSPGHEAGEAAGKAAMRTVEEAEEDRERIRRTQSVTERPKKSPDGRGTRTRRWSIGRRLMSNIKSITGLNVSPQHLLMAEGHQSRSAASLASMTAKEKVQYADRELKRICALAGDTFFLDSNMNRIREAGARGAAAEGAAGGTEGGGENDKTKLEEASSNGKQAAIAAVAAAQVRCILCTLHVSVVPCCDMCNMVPVGFGSQEEEGKDRRSPASPHSSDSHIHLSSPPSPVLPRLFLLLFLLHRGPSSPHSCYPPL